jgi:hypothetical protein
LLPIIRIAISQATFEAIADEHGQRLIWLDRAVVESPQGPARAGARATAMSSCG